MKKVSCMSRAGWSSAKFSDENTCQSSSISGPCATAKPRRLKIDMISSRTNDRGWRVPSLTGDGVRVRSSSSVPSSRNSVASFRSLIFSVASVLSSLMATPTLFFWSAGTFRKSAMRALTAPFLLRYFRRRASTSFVSLAWSASISAFKAFIRSNILCGLIYEVVTATIPKGWP